MSFTKVLLAILLGITVAACGGGGGSSSGSDMLNLQANTKYTGNSNPAAISDTNASTLATKSISGQDSIFTATAATGIRSPGVKHAVDIAKELVLARLNPTSTRGQIPPPTCGGSVIESPQVQTGDNVTGTITFSQYCNTTGAGTITMSGTIAFSATVGQTVTNLTISFIDVTATEQPSNTTVLIAGTISLAATSSTLSMVIQDGTGNQIFLGDYTVDDSLYPLVAISGKFCHSQHGCVTISTPTKLNLTGTWPSSGELLIQGANGSAALLTATGSTYTLRVDVDGNGSYEITHTGMAWPN